MTTLLGSLFGQASQLAARIEAMKQAEISLINLAYRFSDSHKGQHADHAKSHDVEIFDTEIPRSAVPLHNGQCLAGITGCGSQAVANEDEKLIIHGVKVTSNVYKSEVSSSASSSLAPLVMLHGYANGGLYFYRNILGLSNYCFGGTVYSLDMLGWGLSSRPPFKTKSMESEGYDDAGAAELVFVESLEAWRKAHKLEKISLGGHSMGGYLSVAYAEKYPQHVDRLILLSPVGVPAEDDEETQSRKKTMSFRYQMMIGLATSLWNAGVTPSSFLRRMPEGRGRNMVSGYVNQRLPSITCPDEKKHLTEYLYTNAVLPGSGEDCLNKILKPIALAKNPILHRIPKLKVNNVSFIYGQNDWMDANAGIETQNLCDDLIKQGKQNIPNVKVWGVRNAGHLLHIENWKELNNAVIMAGGGGHNLPAHSPRPIAVESDKQSKLFFARPQFGKQDGKDADLSDSDDAPTTATA